MLVVNAAPLRIGLAPLGRLNRAMATADLLKPGARPLVTGEGEIAELTKTLNALLDRLEAERATSSGRVLTALESERRCVARNSTTRSARPHRSTSPAQARSQSGLRFNAFRSTGGPGDHPCRPGRNPPRRPAAASRRSGLLVRDNGRGLRDAPEGAGLRGMCERALLIGAELLIGASPNGGTQVRPDIADASGATQ